MKSNFDRILSSEDVMRRRATLLQRMHIDGPLLILLLTLAAGSLFVLYSASGKNVDLLMKQVRTQEAERALDDMLKSRGKDPDVWYQVAEVRGLSGNTIGLHQARGEFFALVGDYNQALEQLDFAKRRASNNFQLASRIDARQRELMEEQRIIEQMLR